MNKPYCNDPHCPDCNLRRHMQVLLDAGCPPHELVQIVIAALANAVGDVLEIHAIELPSEEDTLH